MDIHHVQLQNDILGVLVSGSPRQSCDITTPWFRPGPRIVEMKFYIVNFCFTSNEFEDPLVHPIQGLCVKLELAD
jgi:hypothetical protein